MVKKPSPPPPPPSPPPPPQSPPPKQQQQSQQQQHQQILTPTTSYTTPLPPTSLPIQFQQKQLLEIGTIKNSCYTLSLRILNEKPSLSSKINELMNNARNDFDEYLGVLSRLIDTYNLCKEEMKLKQSVWVIDDDIDGAIKNILGNGKYIIETNNGSVIKKTKK